MPFKKVRLEGELNANSKPAYPTLPDQVPIFLLPGILGNPIEFYSLIEKLRELGEKRDIYVWFDPLIAKDTLHTTPNNTSLTNQSLLIAENLKQECRAYGAVPYLLVGYSYGCSTAALAAEELQKYNEDTKLYLIDGVSPECAKHYFCHPSASLTTDLINIVKYAATLCPSISDDEISEHNINLSNELVQTLEKLSPLDCIDTVADYIQHHNKNINAVLFATYIKVAKQGIYNLMHAPDHVPGAKIDKIVTLITEQTAKKYGEPHGGWGKYAGKLSIVEDTLLKSQDHRDLLKPTKEEKLALSVARFIALESRPESLLAKHLSHLLAAYCNSEGYTADEPNLDLINRLQETALRLNRKSDSPAPEMEHVLADSNSLPPDSLALSSDIATPSDNTHIATPIASSTQIESFSDNDSSDEDNENGKVNPGVFIATFVDKINHRFRLFPEPCRNETTPPRHLATESVQKFNSVR